MGIRKILLTVFLIFLMFSCTNAGDTRKKIKISPDLEVLKIIYVSEYTDLRSFSEGV